MTFSHDCQMGLTPPGCRLNVAIGDTMIIKHSLFDEKYKVTLVGMQPFDFIILKLPNIQGMLKRFAKGSPIIMRYVHHGVVYGFCTEVLSAITAPSPLIFIAYPQQCETLSLRKNGRIQCLVPCSVYNEEGEYHGYIVDLGVGGCRINFEETTGGALADLAQGSDVYVDFMLCGLEEMFIIKGVLRHYLEGRGKFSLGIEFCGMVADQEQYLSDYIQKVSRAC